MEDRRRGSDAWRALLIVLPLVIACCFGLWYLRLHFLYDTVDYQEISSQDGTWDLTDFDFQHGFVRLMGAVEYIPDALLTPEEFDLRSGEAQVGRAEQPTETSTARLRIRVPDGGVYAIDGHSIDFAERIYINGVRREDVGRPGLSADDSEPDYDYLFFEVRPEHGVIEIVRQSSNFVHRENGSPVGLYLGAPSLIKRHVALEFGLVGVTMGILFALAIAHTLLFGFLRIYRSNLYFALLCLAWGLRTGVTGIKLLGAWFPGLPWEVLFRLEYLTGPVGAILTLLIIRRVFPAHLLPNWFLRGFVGLFGAYGIFCLFCPTRPMSYSVIGFEAAFAVVVLAVAALLAVKAPGMVRRGEMHLEHWVLTAGLALFMFAVVHDALYYNNIYLFGIDDVLNDLAMLVYAFFQMITIFYGSMRRVAEARQAERESRMEAEALRRANQMKEEFLGELSHELKMPITVVSSFAQLSGDMLEDEVLPVEVLRDNMRRMLEEADRMDRMVAELLDVAAIDSGGFSMHMGPVDPAALLRSARGRCLEMAESGGNRLELSLPDGLPEIEGDAERLTQVLLNLVSNAAKHTRDGTITLEAEYGEGAVTVSVSDTGEGIQPELQRHLFERYPEHRSRTGTGLGLYICKKIVHAHGGRIGVESEPGAGTRVWFTLPARSAGEA